MTCRHVVVALSLVLLCSLLPPSARAWPTDVVSTHTSPPREDPQDAWWTGPMLANSAATLPKGHFLMEPYLYDVRTHGANGFGSLTYMLYGLTDRWTVGVVPVLGYNRIDGGPNSAGIGWGDTGLIVQYRLVQFPVESSLPTISLQLREDLPTGRYDRLGDRPADGLGSGTYVTTAGLNTQTWFWLPNGRILRMRINLALSFPRQAPVHGVSVYGTPQDFVGHVRPGRSVSIDAAWEYSLTQCWVLALDLTWQRSQGTLLRDERTRPDRAAVRSATHEAYGFAPAVEYNWSPRIGALFGVRVIPGGDGRARSVTPALAVDIVY